MSENGTLRYIHQDHLTGTSVVSDADGALVNSIKYTPWGLTRAGDVPTDKKFTGQRLDGTGLYYYGARYYDPQIGRFISPDTIIPSPANPQSLNRYSYVYNNPLKYTDPSGHEVVIEGMSLSEMAYLINSGNYMGLLGFNTQYSQQLQGELFQAYVAVASVAPELTSYLVTAKDTINIVETNFTNNIAEFQAGNFGTHSILVNPIVSEMKDRGWLNNAQFAGILGHELFHAAIRIGTGVRDKFAANEAFAYTFGSMVEQKLGGVGDKPFNVEINPWLPSSQLNENLSSASKQLYDFAPKLYSQRRWLFWREPLDVWSKQDKSGEKFLTVAKDVWVK
ncbi:MAG: hypothetical protein A2144_11680 [Chloroflexi bacterium RBG_16_50_9]|nr:MAG: hypothetical protein A2144_11680 [Chloroflexi bacterium RBG_16_50_9]